MRVCLDAQAAVSQRAGVGRYTRSLARAMGPIVPPSECLDHIPMLDAWHPRWAFGGFAHYCAARRSHRAKGPHMLNGGPDLPPIGEIARRPALGAPINDDYG